MYRILKKYDFEAQEHLMRRPACASPQSDQDLGYTFSRTTTSPICYIQMFYALASLYIAHQAGLSLTCA